jgi:hypothetical protein
MATYFEYELDEGGTILIAADDEAGGLVPAGRTGDVIKEAGVKFQEAFAVVKSWVSTLSQQLSEMDAEEVKISFGLKVTGEGNFAVGKLGAEANYQVTLKWSNKPAE